ncbi:MAG: flavin-dependent oxidoreductase [Planktotalea sp.]|uniref:flavin-dependent oxidoreductase n=1 Tax=Planktotalea sp. TaxID=2029877 RepID=UPI003C78AC99
MEQPHILIAGGGIGGLCAALTLHQVGIGCTVLESVRDLKPLGVGINLQPNAVRELFELGIDAAALDQIGVPVKEWALVGLNGNDIYSEPRGTLAGYHWPQYAVHRGKLHMLLFETLKARAGADAIKLDAQVTGYRKESDGRVTALIKARDGARSELSGTLMIGADGIHSAVRAQMHPDQPDIHWGGAVMWRGTTRAKPIRTGSSFIGLGTHEHRMVIYPISDVDAEGYAEINWIAEITYDDPSARDGGWFKPVPIDAFAHYFDGWDYDWLDVPALLGGAPGAYENPMIDRDPIPTWVDGPVALLGDAAHAMYPTGSNGASQAIIDGRILAAKFLEHGVTPAALQAYDVQLCAPVGELVLRNRGAGPFGLLNLVNERCGGRFDDINDVLGQDERTEFMAKYKIAAGFAMESLNAAPSILQIRAQKNGEP